MRVTGVVAWACFEQAGDRLQYRAGLRFATPPPKGLATVFPQVWSAAPRHAPIAAAG